MSTLKCVMAELNAKGSDKTWAIYEQHRIPAGRSFGVSAAELKAIAKTIKGIRLWRWSSTPTGNMDAMYLAGMVANGFRNDEGRVAGLGGRSRRHADDR